MIWLTTEGFEQRIDRSELHFKIIILDKVWTLISRKIRVEEWTSHEVVSVAY